MAYVTRVMSSRRVITRNINNILTQFNVISTDSSYDERDMQHARGISATLKALIGKLQGNKAAWKT
jgi:hypothetical protein